MSDASTSASAIRKTRKRKVFNGQARQLICSVREYFEKEKANGGPLISFNKVLERTAAACEVGKNLIVRIGKEKDDLLTDFSDTQPKFHTPNKKRNIDKKVTKLDSFQENAIRQHIYSYYCRKEHPTINKLHKSLAAADLFAGSKSSVRKVLQNIGFKFTNISGRKVLMESESVVALRCRFLREIQTKSIEGIVWLDETWVNIGHSLRKGWTDDTVKGTMKIPLGRGGRYIIVHAGTSKGFIPNCFYAFKSKKTSDFHEEMNSENFTKWFTDSLLKNLTVPSTVVMDNAPYHSVIYDKAPTLATRKEEIIHWLHEHNISTTVSMKKAELLELVSGCKPRFPEYVIDKVAQEHGHKVVRLPPYHCHFNPIELIWAQVKGYVARNNKTFTGTEVEKLIREGITNVTADDWRKAVMHTKKVIDEAWSNEGILEDAVEQLVINLGTESSDSSDSGSDISGVTPLD